MDYTGNEPDATPQTKQILFKPFIKKKQNIFPRKKVYKKNKKRVASEKWNLPSEYLTFEKQWEMIQQTTTTTTKEMTDINPIPKEYKTLLREIERKIYSYKQQDIEKQMFDAEKFLSFENVRTQMLQCNMKCYYCFCEMYLLYEIVRESKQWTVDRLDNDKGHNRDNFVLACLECNLKRRRRTSDKFLFTQQLSIVKKE